MYDGHKVIALCIAKISMERNLELIQAFNEAVCKEDYRLFVYQTCSDLFQQLRSENGDKAVFDLMDFDIIDAVVIFNESFHDDELVECLVHTANKNHVPVVSLGVPFKGAISLDFDDGSGFEKIVRHVIEEHGKKDTILVAGLKGEEHSERRIEIYKRVLRDNGIPVTEKNIIYGDYWYEPTERELTKVIASGHMPEAFICANDAMAITTCEFLYANGFSVPKDVIVTGFDGIPESLTNIPTISTVKFDWKLTFDCVMEVLVNIFNGKPVEDSYTIPYTLDIHCSCGCPECAELHRINQTKRYSRLSDAFNQYQSDELSLYEITEEVMTSQSPKEFVKHLDKFKFWNTCIMINPRCFDAMVNPAEEKTEQSFEDILQVVYVSDNNGRYDLPYAMPKKEMAPLLNEWISHSNPIIFSSLSFYGIPAGYIVSCFTATRHDYCKVLQYVASINKAIGSYRLTNYLRYTADSIAKMAISDYLTGINNRHGFYDELPDLLGKAAGKEVMVASIDMDGLKRINDTYGHECGDFAIKTVSEVVSSLPFKDYICGRFGGDEFVVCAICEKEVADNEKYIAEYVARCLQEFNAKSDKEFKVSASVGAYITPSKDFDFKAALRESDEKMYLVKLGHPNRRKN
ncbi:MAG: GGDEF domain-containing protein [Lachnospiraceae bacterium]|nr:GGDEF domain-containing protein [Lachnospiraceae bacterium]